MNKILVATDFTELSSIAIQAAHNWSTSWKAQPILVHINDFLNRLEALPIPATLKTPELVSESKWLDEVVEKNITEQLSQLKIERQSIQVRVLKGKITTELAECCQKEKADLLFVGSHSHSLLERNLLGSITEKLARTLPLPLVIVKNQAVCSPQKILFTTDFSTASQNNFKWLAQIAQKFAAQVKIVHVVTAALEDYADDYSIGALTNLTMDKIIQEQKAEAQKQLNSYQADPSAQGLELETVVLESYHQDVAQTLLEYAEEQKPDLVFIASSGKGKIKKFLFGSTTDKFIRQSKMSVFLYK